MFVASVIKGKEREGNGRAREEEREGREWRRGGKGDMKANEARK